MALLPQITIVSLTNLLSWFPTESSSGDIRFPFIQLSSLADLPFMMNSVITSSATDTCWCEQSSEKAKLS